VLIEELELLLLEGGLKSVQKVAPGDAPTEPEGKLLHPARLPGVRRLDARLPAGRHLDVSLPAGRRPRVGLTPGRELQDPVHPIQGRYVVIGPLG